MYTMFFNLTGAPKIVLGLARCWQASIPTAPPGAVSAVKNVMKAQDARLKHLEKRHKLPINLPIRTKRDALDAHNALMDQSAMMKVVQWLVQLCQEEYKLDTSINCNKFISNALIGRFDGSFLFISEFIPVPGGDLAITDLKKFVLENVTHKLPLNNVHMIREVHERALSACEQLGIFTPAPPQRLVSFTYVQACPTLLKLDN